MTDLADLHALTARDLHELLHRGEVRPREVAEHYLDRIERLGGEVSAFAHVDAEAALARADVVEREMPRVAPLWGMPLADKDLQQRAGMPTRFGSRMFADHVSDTSDDLVRAVDAAGAVSVGKTATPEFGLASYTEGGGFPPARTPWDLTRGAGGSSGGAAAAVAAGLLPFAPGSDGGGSIRIPAASCGVVGVKPSRGRVPAGSGLGGLAGLGVAGAIARDVADAALLLDGMIAPTGYPTRHAFAVRAPGEDGPYLGAAIRGEGRFQVGVMTDSPWDEFADVRLDDGARAALDRAVALLDRTGHGVEWMDAAPEPGYPAAFETIWQVGAATVPVIAGREELLDPLTLWLRERGSQVSAAALAEALSWLSQFERRLIARFAPYDVVLTPALALPPRPVGWYDQEDGHRNFVQQCAFSPYTSMVNVAGLPALTLPMTVTDDALPMGVQLIGRPGGEATLFSLASQLERVGGKVSAQLESRS